MKLGPVMSIRLSICALTSVVAGLMAQPAAAMDAAEVFAKVAQSIWEVRVIGANGQPTAQGTAVVIGDGLAITNCHVLRGGKQIAIRHGNVAFGARLLYPDVERDLCELRVAEFHYPGVTVAPSASLVTGQKVYAVGSPLGLELTISEGLISSLRNDADGRLRRIQTSAAISHGSSGGGLFDANGRLVGITASGFEATDGQNLNFAIPADWIAEVPDRGQKALATRAAAASTVAVNAATPPGSVAPPAPAPRRPGELGSNQQAGFDMYLKKVWPKSFVTSDGDHYSWAVGQNAELRAIAFCTERWINCRVFARNDTVIDEK